MTQAMLTMQKVCSTSTGKDIKNWIFYQYIFGSYIFGSFYVFIILIWTLQKSFFFKSTSTFEHMILIIELLHQIVKNPFGLIAQKMRLFCLQKIKVRQSIIRQVIKGQCHLVAQYGDYVGLKDLINILSNPLRPAFW